MDFEAFRILEDKINRVLEKVEMLKQENSDLRNRLETLREDYNEKAAEVERITLELQQAKENTRDLEKEEKIREKVSGLLEKLENF